MSTDLTAKCLSCAVFVCAYWKNNTNSFLAKKLFKQVFTSSTSLSNFFQLGSALENEVNRLKSCWCYTMSGDIQRAAKLETLV